MTERPWPADRVERRPVDSLIEYARNARLHTEDDVALIAASITEFGWTTPVIVDKDGVLVAGHGRVMAARKLGLGTVPVAVAEDWTEEQVKAYRLIDNQYTLRGRWDAGLLKIELDELRGLDFDTDLLGFAGGEIEALDLGADLSAGDPDGPAPRTGNLADRFGVPPFSVLNAREGWWQERKRAWLALGIKSELGRGAAPGGAPMPLDRAGGGANATPGGSMMPACDYGKSRKRGDGRGRPVG